jgi:phospholipase C
MTLASTHYQHVIWIWMENHSYSTIIGSSDAPYINSLARRCGLATNYHNISHLSLTNYVGATSGLSVAAVNKFSGDCDPSPTCSTGSPSIFGQASSWRAYEESMPSNCDNSNSGEYAVRHNPPVYYSTLRGCSSFDVPFTRLASDLANHNLPAFAFVTPNVVSDMHDGTVAQGDAWLATHLPTIVDSSAYSRGSVVVFVTWDEGEGGAISNCPTNATDLGCHVATLVVSPSTTPRTTSATLFNHYGLLRTTEELLHVPLLGQAAQARSMKVSFGL